MTALSLSLSEELRELTGWTDEYTLGFIVAKILSIGNQVKFKYQNGKVVATAPQQMRFEARSPEDAACLMLIELVKRGNFNESREAS